MGNKRIPKAKTGKLGPINVPRSPSGASILLMAKNGRDISASFDNPSQPAVYDSILIWQIFFVSRWSFFTLSARYSSCRLVIL
jgi:hypothetical protein